MFRARNRCLYTAQKQYLKDSRSYINRVREQTMFRARNRCLYIAQKQYLKDSRSYINRVREQKFTKFIKKYIVKPKYSSILANNCPSNIDVSTG